MRNFYLIFMLVCFMGGMVLSAKAEEKEPLVIEMLNKRGKAVSYTHLTLPTIYSV